MDLLFLLDRLEEALLASPRVPGTRRRIVDQEDCLAILEQVRFAVPEALVASSDLHGREVRPSPPEQGWSELLERFPQVRAARTRAALLEETAQRDGQLLCREAEAYPVEQLDRLARQVARARQAVDRALAAAVVPTAASTTANAGPPAGGEPRLGRVA